MNETIYIPQTIKKQWDSKGLKSLQAFLQDGLELIQTYGSFHPNAIPYLDKRYELRQLLNISEDRFGVVVSRELLKEIGELFAACVGTIKPNEFNEIKEAYPSAIKFVEEI